MAPRRNEDALSRALGYFRESEEKHSEFVQKVEARYKAYRGVLDRVSDAAQWTSKLHPPYIQHIVETTLASMVEDRIRFRIRPRVTLELIHDPEASKRSKEGARAHQILFDWQIRQSRFNEIQRPFCLQNAIAGLTVAKTFWTTDRQRRRRLKRVEEPVLDHYGMPVTGPDGAPMSVTKMVEANGEVVVYDGPTTEVRDVRDFGWHEAAVSLERSRYVWDRVWLSPEEVRDAVSAGAFGPEVGGWAEKEISASLATSSQKDMYAYREQELFSQDRTKDLVEVVEVWDTLRREVTTFANRSALLSHKPFPFWHEQPPFVVCSTQPDLFRIPGVSQVEKISHLQTMLWDLQNQRIDNLRLINNAIFLFSFDAEDADQYTFEPGARWPVEDPTQVNMWSPNVIPAEVSLGAEALMKGDLQNLSGGFPFASGTDSQTVDQKTATGASIVSSLAQRSVNLARAQLNMAWGRVGEQRMLLNQQFLRTATVVPVVGLDGEEYAETVTPELLAGDFSFEMEPSSDALMKQEDQAAAQGMLQTIVSIVPVVSALAQAGAAKMINIDAFVEDFLKAFGKEDTDRYFASQAPPSVGAAPQSPTGPQGQTGGVTAPQSIDPAVSPSAQTSLAPTTMLQRLMASQGGGQNTPL